VGFRETILKNFQEDFKELLPSAPGYLNCRIVAGYGNCEDGFVSDDTKTNGMMLLNAREFEFDSILKVISTFRGSEPKTPLLVFIGLVIPSGTVYIYRFYEIEVRDSDIIFLKNKSKIEG